MHFRVSFFKNIVNLLMSFPFCENQRFHFIERNNTYKAILCWVRLNPYTRNNFSIFNFEFCLSKTESNNLSNISWKLKIENWKINWKLKLTNFQINFKQKLIVIWMNVRYTDETRDFSLTLKGSNILLELKFSQWLCMVNTSKKKCIGE